MQFSKALQHTIGWKTINTFLTFLINLILVRILGAELSGDFFYTVTILSFLSLLMSWSMESGIIYYGSRNKQDLPALLWIAIVFILIQAVLCWGLIQFIPVNLDASLSRVFVISNLMIVYLSALFYAHRWFVSFNGVICLVNALVVLTLAGIYFLYHSSRVFSPGIYPQWLGSFIGEFTHFAAHEINSSPLGLLAAIIYICGFLCQALVLIVVYAIRDGGAKRPVIDTRLAQKLFYYSSIAFISNILFFLVTRIDYLFVEIYCDEIALSNYVQVSKMGQMLILIPGMIAGVIFPYSSANTGEDQLKHLQALCRKIGLLFLPVAGLIAISGYWVFPWLFGSGFEAVFPALLLYLPGFYSLSMVTLLAAHLAGRALLSKNLIASILALVVVITGDFLMIPITGIYGAAMVSSIGYSICLVYLLNVFTGKLGAIRRDFFILRVSKE